MNPRPKKPAAAHRTESAVGLRRRADARLESQPPSASEQSEADSPRLLHELRVHQIELEMQNEDLRKSQTEAETAAARYNNLYDLAPVGYFTLNTEGVIMAANPAGVRLLGARRPLPGRRFGAFVAGADYAVFNPFLRQIFAGETAPACALTLVSKGQPPRVVQLTAALASGGQECYLAATDITERQRVEGQARQWQEMFKAGEFALARTDPHTNTFVEVNPACARGLGYTCAEMVGRSALDIYPPEVHAEMRLRMQDVNQVGHLTFESIHLRKDGTRFPVLVDVTTIYDAQKQPVARVAYALDLTGRRQAEARLRESETHYRLLAETGEDVVWLFDLRTQRFSYVSPAVERFLGYTVAEFQRQPLAELLTPDSCQMVERRLPVRLAAFAAGDDSVRHETAEVWQVRRDRSSVVTEISTTLIADERRQVTHIQGVTRDITERKQAEERSRRLRDLGFVVAANEDLPAVLRLCLDTAILISGMDAGGIYLVEEPSGGLKLECHTGLSPDFVAAVACFPADSDNVRWARKNQPYHGHAKGRESSVLTAEMREGLQALSLIPIYHDGHLIGVLNVASHTVAEVPLAARDVLETIASLVGGLIQRLRAKQALAEGENRQRAILDNIPDPAWLKDSAGRFLTVNQAWLDHFDRTREEVIGKTMFDFVPRELAGDLAQQEATALAAGEAVSREEEVPDSTGRPEWFETTKAPLYTAAGGLQGTIGIARNVTARKRAELALSQLNVELEQRVRERTAEALDLYNHAPCGYHSLGPDGVVLQMNDTELGWLGYARDEVVGQRRLADLMSPAVAELFEAQFRKFQQQLAPASSEWDLRCQDGSLITLLINGEAVRDEAGRFLHSRATVMNITERKRSENLLRLFKDLVQASSDAIGMSDPEGNHYYQNSAFDCLFGEIGNCPPVTLYVDPEVGKQVFDTIKGGGSWLGEVRMFKHDRTIVTIFLRAYAIKDQAGRVLGLVGMHVDITEHNRAEAALRKSEERLKEAQRIAHLGYLDWDLQTNEVVLSEEALAIYHLDRDPTTRPLAEIVSLVHPEDRARVGQSLAAVAAGLVPHDMEHRMVCPDGEVVMVRATAELFRDADGNAARIIGTIVDITARKRAEDALRESEQKYRLLFDSAGDAIFIHDLDGRMLAANRLAQAQLGYTLEEILALNVSQVDAPEERQQVPQRVAQLLAQGNITFETVHQRKDGSLFPIEASAQHIAWEGKPAILSITRDIAERRRSAEELRQAKESADAANRAKSVFLANMSHEIRTPMNAILGFSQLLRREPGLSAQQQQRLDTINRSGEHLIRLISDILDMAKIESGQMQVMLEDCDFLALLADVEAVYRSRVEERRLSFVVQHGPGLPSHLYTDAGKVRQVLYNVLSNAVKFTVQGGIQVRVSATLAPPTEVGQPVARLCIEMTDTGPGIAEAESDRVFVAFEQTQSGRRLGGGTGLGLAISQRLARKLGGDLTFASREGVGSTFQFTFVAAVKDSVSAGAAPTVPARRVSGLKLDGPPPTVLVADDTESNRQLLHNLLELVGFHVLVAEDGGSAVAQCQAARPALVLMDIRMPGLNGLDSIRAIRAAPGGQAMRILIVSADVLDTSEEDWRAAGADGFISKPFRNEELLLQIGELLKVAYIYSEPSAAAAVHPALAPDAIAKLPVRLRADLIRATENGNGARLRELIAQEVALLDPALGQALGHLAAQYDYHTLLHVLNEKRI